MAETTGIAWTDHSWSPWRGCAKVSPGCTNCYAAALAARFPQHGTWGTSAQGGRRVIAASASWDTVRAWNRKAKRDGVKRTVFPSMCDPFEVFDGPCGLVLEGRTFVALDDTLDTVRARLWTLAEETESLVWLFLTKRPENAPRMVPSAWDRGWPRNVLIGTTVEDQRRADERLPHLLRIPARRFLSVEPQLEAVDLMRWIRGDFWVINGGERCAGARPFDLAWARSLRNQCHYYGVPYFFKQAGDNTVGYSELRAKSPLEDIPSDLRIREVPSW